MSRLAPRVRSLRRSVAPDTLTRGSRCRAASAGLAIACAIALACASGPPRGATSSAPAAGAEPAPQLVAGSSPQARARAHDEIDALDREIAGQLARAQIAEPQSVACSGASCAEAMTAPLAAAPAADPSCHPAASDRCTDTCTLAGSICHNQDRICELARQLDGDDWAANHCSRARASCRAAHERCCSCVL